jgi:hypothetical protein
VSVDEEDRDRFAITPGEFGVAVDVDDVPLVRQVPEQILDLASHLLAQMAART